MASHDAPDPRDSAVLPGAGGVAAQDAPDGLGAPDLPAGEADAGSAAIELRASHPMARRFRGFLPVVVDVETGGFDCRRHALLEIAAVAVVIGEDGMLRPGETVSTHVDPFPGALLDPKSMEVTGIDVGHPFRFAKAERAALDHIFHHVRAWSKAAGCQRAILVGHNAHFDLDFLNAAVARTSHKRNPFHPFSTFDTVTLAGMAYGQTVLSRAMQAAGLDFDGEQAHSAVYDAERTAELFCRIQNRWQQLARFDPERADLPGAG
jgi:ribonuclease T